MYVVCINTLRYLKLFFHRILCVRVQLRRTAWTVSHTGDYGCVPSFTECLLFASVALHAHSTQCRKCGHWISEGLFDRYDIFMHTNLALKDYQKLMISLDSQCIVLSDKANKRYLVASVSGNHDDEWVELTILVNMDVEYFVMFEAETGTSEHTYIAIDDVSFTYVSVI